MGDFPPQWTWIRDLDEGGQGHTYVVKRSDGSDPAEYVLKRLKNINREEYFDREIQAYKTLNHPNLLKIVDHGDTPKGKPYLITPFCEGGSLQESEPFQRPIDGMRVFHQICTGIAHAHESGVYHLDIKPANIFLKKAVPMVGDFGICFIESDKYVMTSDGPRGSIWYCAPELRDPKIEPNIKLPPADVYSLGKVLHWLFAHEVYDGNEQAYSKRAERRLAERFPAFPEFAFVDELIEGTVRGNAGERVQTAAKLVDWAQTVIDRIEVGGRVLDFTKPIRCLFCGLGTYKALAPLPPIEERLAPTNPATLPSSRFDIYEYMRDAAHAKGFPFSPGGTYSIGPLILTCQHCGNVQEFRLDLAPEAIKNWKP